MAGVAAAFEPVPTDLGWALEAAAARLGSFARLRFRSSVDSTNDVALSLANAGEGTGASVLADQQAAGRGRRGRTWFSPAGAGLYLSVIVRPSERTKALPVITLAAGVAAARAVQAISGLPIDLKWPNDLVVGKRWRKLGGVLCEATGSGSGVDAIVIGLGMNLLRTSYPREIADRATSLDVEVGRQVDRAAMVVEVLAQLRVVVEQYQAGDLEAIIGAWRTFGRGGLGGATVGWQDRQGPRRGRAMDIDHDGALLVEVDGLTERLMAGEVIWESRVSE